jgi:hypothetical protein
MILTRGPHPYVFVSHLPKNNNLLLEVSVNEALTSLMIGWH